MGIVVQKKATRHAMGKIAERTFAGSRVEGFFYDTIIADCEEIARPLMARGFLLGGKSILRIFESAPVHEKWFSWFQYFILCYLTEDVPMLDRRYLDKIYESGSFPLPELEFYAKVPNLEYERSRIVHALSEHYPRSSPYFFLANGLTALAARPGFYAPAFAPIYFYYLNEQNYDMVLASAYMFFRECDQKNLYPRIDPAFLDEILEVFEWVSARPDPGTGLKVVEPTDKSAARTTKKPVKKAAKKTAKVSKKKPVKKAAKKSTKKAAKKSAKKASKKAAKKTSGAKKKKTRKS